MLQCCAFVFSWVTTQRNILPGRSRASIVSSSMIGSDMDGLLTKLCCVTGGRRGESGLNGLRQVRRRQPELLYQLFIRSGVDKLRFPFQGECINGQYIL